MQIEKLKTAGCDKIFQEKNSGAGTGAGTGATDAERTLSVQQPTNALSFLREGDQFVGTRLDRLARSVRDLSNVQY